MLRSSDDNQLSLLLIRTNDATRSEIFAGSTSILKAH